MPTDAKRRNNDVRSKMVRSLLLTTTVVAQTAAKKTVRKAPPRRPQSPLKKSRPCATPWPPKNARSSNCNSNYSKPFRTGSSLNRNLQQAQTAATDAQQKASEAR